MRKEVRSFRKNVSGNLSVVTSICLVPLAAVAGASLDWMRLNDSRTQLYAAMDGAVLAGTQA